MIAIKDREMPKNCAGCFLRVGQCSKRIYMENRPSDCPLIEVPEPHGRLIDADAMCEGRVRNDNVVICAKCAPTVIPASVEGEA